MARATLAISGDPEVGKSALTLRAADALAAGAAITALSLRDLRKLRDRAGKLD